ncbi:MAG: hypothetical protein Ct9H300mP8_00380 [Gammaproteobacteria bacterium]|nr:MAG: hypothetical protein Ct9H300mP8_00380 [Gammaproteobacteria bacterium]
MAVIISYEVAGAGYLGRRPTSGEALQASTCKSAHGLSTGDFGLRSLKDPVVYLRDGRWWVYIAGPARERLPRKGASFCSPLDATLLGRSDDGLYFPELEWVFEAPGTDTWHGRRARINSVISRDNGWLRSTMAAERFMTPMKSGVVWPGATTESGLSASNSTNRGCVRPTVAFVLYSPLSGRVRSTFTTNIRVPMGLMTCVSQ